MARMIPPFVPDDAPPGEQAVYRALAGSRDADDWIVLHSLNIAEHVRNPEGEADFVVIAPGLGLVVIEVKSHEQIDVRDGAWYLGRRRATTRGPFTQASDAMHSLRRQLEKKVDMHSVPTLSAVWFTAVRARTLLKPSPEWANWQVLDAEDLRQDPIRAIRRVFAGGIAHLEKTLASFSHREIGPDEKTTIRIGRLLRPNFELGVVTGDIRSGREGQLVRFVNEQYEALDAMADNQAVLFKGPAGSGKTFLAMEAARREIAKGHSRSADLFQPVAWATFDGRYVGRPQVDCRHVPPPANGIGGISMRRHGDDKFWQVELPERVIETLLDLNGDGASDFLIIDEVQDLAREPYMEIFDLMVKGGLATGKVLLFADFERQAIYDNGTGERLLKSAYRIYHDIA